MDNQPQSANPRDRRWDAGGDAEWVHFTSLFISTWIYDIFPCLLPIFGKKFLLSLGVATENNF